MNKKATVRLNVEFPSDDYPDLKFLCAKRGLSLRAMVTELLLKEIEEAEEIEFSNHCKDRFESRKEADLIDWDDAQALAGWK